MRHRFTSSQRRQACRQAGVSSRPVFMNVQSGFEINRKVLHNVIMLSQGISGQRILFRSRIIGNRSIYYKIIIFAFFISFSILAPAGCSTGEQKHHVPHTQHKFDDIEKWAARFEDPERAEWQKPEEVLKHLNLRAGDVIADIGAGTGYFTRRFAEAVGPRGKALGLDIEPAMVEYMKEDARKLNLDNYVARLVKPGDPDLSPQSVNVIFMCNTLHHIEDRVTYLRRLSKNLKPDGRIVIVDYYKRPLRVGPSPAIKLAKDQVIREFQEAGYRLKRSPDFLPYQYFLEFGL